MCRYGRADCVECLTARVRRMKSSRSDIQFTKTDDGIGIAYWEVGAGSPLVIVQSRVMNHAELEWDVPAMRAWYLELARYFRVIRLDARGCGLSDDPPSEDFYSLAGMGSDIRAVVGALGLEQFNLMAILSMGPVAIQYAVDHSEQVAGLVLCETGPVLVDLPLDKYARVTSASMELDVVPSYTELADGLSNEDIAAVAALTRASQVDRPFTNLLESTWNSYGVTRLLPEVTAPTLVIRSSDTVLSSHTETRKLATGIPNAQMRIVSGKMAPWTSVTEAVEALVTFLTTTTYTAPTSDGEGEDELRTVVFTDLVSSTEILSRLGDEQGREEFRSVESTVVRLCAEHHGRLIKNLGDGSLVSFKSTGRAIRFALDLQNQMDDSPFDMRIGMAAGEPIQEDGDIHGAVVVQASRIADVGEAGETIVSNSVRLLSVGKDFHFEPWGDIQLKGFDETSTLWRVTKPARP